MPELSDEEFAIYQGSKALMDELLKSPQTKRAQEKLIKQLHPNTVISEDHEAPLRGEIDELKKTVSDYITAQTNKAIDDKLGKDFDALRSEGFTDDGIEQVKRIMVDRQIRSPVDAAAVWRKLNPTPATVPSLDYSTGWGIGAAAASKDEEQALLFKDDDAWLDRMVPRIVADAKKGIYSD